MAYLTSTRPAPFGAKSADLVVQVLRTLTSAVSRWADNRRGEVAILRMTERELADTGIIRVEAMQSRFSQVAARV